MQEKARCSMHYYALLSRMWLAARTHIHTETTNTHPYTRSYNVRWHGRKKDVRGRPIRVPVSSHIPVSTQVFGHNSGDWRRFASRQPETVIQRSLFGRVHTKSDLPRPATERATSFTSRGSRVFTPKDATASRRSESFIRRKT